MPHDDDDAHSWDATRNGGPPDGCRNRTFDIFRQMQVQRQVQDSGDGFAWVWITKVIFILQNIYKICIKTTCKKTDIPKKNFVLKSKKRCMRWLILRKTMALWDKWTASTYQKNETKYTKLKTKSWICNI